MGNNNENYGVYIDIKYVRKLFKENTDSINEFLTLFENYRTKYFELSSGYNKKTFELCLKKKWYKEMYELLSRARIKYTIARALKISIQKNLKYISILEHYSICEYMSSLLEIDDPKIFIEMFLCQIYEMFYHGTMFVIKRDYLKIISNILRDFANNMNTALHQYEIIVETYDEILSVINEGIAIDSNLINKLKEQDYYTNCFYQNILSKLAFRRIEKYNNKINAISTTPSYEKTDGEIINTNHHETQPIITFSDDNPNENLGTNPVKK